MERESKAIFSNIDNKTHKLQIKNHKHSELGKKKQTT